MIETPKITLSAAQLTAIIHVTIPRMEIQRIMGPSIAELLSAVAAQSLAPAGPVFAHHLKMDPDTFDFEIGVPVTQPVSPAGRVKPGELPATKVARTVYHGAYEGLYSAWGEFGAWISANGYKRRPDLWECYLAGPELNADPSAWRTELNQPLVD